MKKEGADPSLLSLEVLNLGVKLQFCHSEFACALRKTTSFERKTLIISGVSRVGSLGPSLTPSATVEGSDRISNASARAHATCINFHPDSNHNSQQQQDKPISMKQRQSDTTPSKMSSHLPRLYPVSKSLLSLF